MTTTAFNRTYVARVAQTKFYECADLLSPIDIPMHGDEQTQGGNPVHVLLWDSDSTPAGKLALHCAALELC